MTAPRYAQPPIIEAVIDFQMKGAIDAPALERLSQAFADHYAHAVLHPHINLHVEPDGIRVENTPSVRRIDMHEPADVLILRPDGFTVSRLAPYQSWSRSWRSRWISASAQASRVSDAVGPRSRA
jgi:uncharacterized protein (TIGR04255 family)